ncbi:YlxR family protein [bacterium]|nr:YlxR family protein [bacterium]
MTKDIQRKCIGCFEMKNRDELIKITRESNTGNVFINPNSKIFGRSAYLCYNDTCIKNAFKKNKLQKFLKANLSEELEEKLKNIHKD